MADNGVLYTGFTPEFALEMGKLCGKADVIVPNLTEAAFMLGEEYVGDDYDEAYVHALLKRLTGLGCKTAILTGISYQPGQIGAVAYDSVTDTYASYFNEKLPVRFHGTGDVFASACVGGADERQGPGRRPEDRRGLHPGVHPGDHEGPQGQLVRGEL